MSRPDSSDVSYEQWLDYAFTQGYGDFSSDSPEAFARFEHYDVIPAPTVASFLLQLCSNPQTLRFRFTPDQIGDGVTYAFGCATFNWHTIRDDKVSIETQQACWAAIPTIYRQLFDALCCRDGTAPDDDCRNEARIDGAVYMIWDMGGGIASPTLFPEEHPQLADVAFRSLETILHQCRTSTCRISALHALSHAQLSSPARIEAIIDRFTSTTRLPPFLADYAVRARTGPMY
ncbi:MAG: hypothetical protein AAFX79_08065 [Planctomycetota bacterium]